MFMIIVTFFLSFSLLHADTLDCLFPLFPILAQGPVYFYNLILLLQSRLAASCLV